MDGTTVMTEVAGSVEATFGFAAGYRTLDAQAGRPKDVHVNAQYILGIFTVLQPGMIPQVPKPALLGLLNLPLSTIIKIGPDIRGEALLECLCEAVGHRLFELCQLASCPWHAGSCHTLSWRCSFTGVHVAVA